MTLITSISGIRGTIGGKVGEGLSPIDAQKYSLAYGIELLSRYQNPTVVIGRDARISGKMISDIVSSSLIGLGIDIIDLQLSTTPTVEKSVVKLNAQGGIIITASHNPKEWNALKLLNNKGEFISDIEGKKIIELANTVQQIEFPDIDHLGHYSVNDTMMEVHVNEICAMKWIQLEAIKSKKISVVVDGINSTGSIVIPMLLKSLGVNTITVINDIPNGHFAHNPEPLAAHLTEIAHKVVELKADLGIVVDPDVDRLCFVNEDGTMFGEEYTLVAVADYLLSIQSGNTVSNLSSTRALRDITQKHGGTYTASAVGEVNVVAMMKHTKALIGGEGNGGVIFPESHYGRDALMGVALFLSYFATKNKTMTELKKELPMYYMSKNKIELLPETNVESLIENLHAKYKMTENCNIIDGLKIDFADSWVHLRKSNTEQIIRIYSEATTQQNADEMALRFVNEIKLLM